MLIDMSETNPPRSKRLGLRILRKASVALALGIGALTPIISSAQVTAGGAQFPPFENYRIASLLEPITSMAPITDVTFGNGEYTALRSDGSFISFFGGGELSGGVWNVRFSKIVGGYSHFVGLALDGSVHTWGRLGYTVPSFSKKVVDVATSEYNDGVVFSDGTVKIWGQNKPSLLDLPAGLANVKQLALGTTHGLALKNDGTVVTWGRGAQIIPKDLKEVVQVVANGDYSVALQANGQVVSWGFNTAGIEPNLSRVVRIAFANAPFSGSPYCGLALLDDGTVKAIGADGQGRALQPPADLGPCISICTSGALGAAVRIDGSVAVWGPNTVSVNELRAPCAQGLVKLGPHVGLQYDGVVRAWGSNFYGECNVPAGLVAKDVREGNGFVVALKTNATVAAWGKNDFGQCNVPPGLKAVKQIAVGKDHVLALKNDGTVTAWGSPELGKATVPAGLSGVIQVAAGDTFSLALKSDGTVVAWGGGQGSDVPSGLGDVKSIFAGEETSIALRKDKSIVPWGALVGYIPLDRLPYTDFAIGDSGVLAVYSSDDGSGDNWTTMYGVWGTEDGYLGGVSKVTTFGGLPFVSGFTPDTFIPSGTTGSAMAIMPVPPGAQGATIPVKSDNAALTVPASVFLAQGIRNVSFPITAQAVTKPTVCTLTIGGQLVSVTITPPAALGGVSVNRTFVGGSANVPLMGQVVLTAPAITEKVVTLTSSTPGMIVPHTVKVSPGFDTVSFPISTANVTATETVTITASTPDGVTKTATIELRPLVVNSLVLKASSVVTPATTAATVTISSITDYDRTVTLATSKTSLVTLPASVVVPAGSSSVKFTFKVKKVTTATDVTVKATYNGNSKNVTLTLTPS